MIKDFFKQNNIDFIEDAPLINHNTYHIKSYAKFLVYPKNIDDVVLNGMVKGVNIKFQFRLNDGTGDGVYVTMGETQLSDANTKTIEKIRAAFQNWKSSITEDGKLMSDLENAAKRKKENPE